MNAAHKFDKIILKSTKRQVAFLIQLGFIERTQLFTATISCFTSSSENKNKLLNSISVESFSSFLIHRYFSF